MSYFPFTVDCFLSVYLGSDTFLRYGLLLGIYHELPFGAASRTRTVPILRRRREEAGTQ